MKSPKPDHQLNIGHEKLVKCTYLTDTPKSWVYIQEDQKPFTRSKTEKCKLGKKPLFPIPTVRRRRNVVIPPEIQKAKMVETPNGELRRICHSLKHLPLVSENSS